MPTIKHDTVVWDGDGRPGMVVRTRPPSPDDGDCLVVWKDTLAAAWEFSQQLRLAPPSLHEGDAR